MSLLQLFYSGWLLTKHPIERIMVLFQGQSMDLFWTYNGHCPELDHYYRMVNQSKLKSKALEVGPILCSFNPLTGRW